MPRKTSSNPLANALDNRVRAVVEEALENALRGPIRRVIQEELASALATGAAPRAIGARRGARAPGRRAKPGKPNGAVAARVCEVAGCKRPYRSQGYCAAHYQAARKYGWPMPAPKGFVPPPRPPRGRPARENGPRAD